MKNKIRIIQLLPTMAYGDAVGNDTLALYEVLSKAGYSTGIYAENIGDRVPAGIVKRVNAIPRLREKDIIIYHLSTGTELNFKLPEYHCRKILIYHNITPSHYFKNYSRASYELCQSGREGMIFLADKVDYCLADSEYDKRELVDAGYQCKIDVLPILIPFSDYKKEPSQKIISQYSGDGYINILFTGRIAPNKKQEDLIRAFYFYQKYYNPRSRLFLVGSYSGMESYYHRLVKYAGDLGLENVFFTGHIDFDEILAYYKIANVFLCLSDHEGFCVPLVEAMSFDVPIIACSSSAIGDTLGGSSILLSKKDPLEIAGMIDYVIRNPEWTASVVEKQRARLKDFEHDKIERQFLDYLGNFIGEHL